MSINPGEAQTGDCEGCSTTCDNPGRLEFTDTGESEKCVAEDTMITFQAPQVTHSGGRLQIYCPKTGTRFIDIQGTPILVWKIKPPSPGVPIEGQGAVANILAEWPGTYRCEFEARVEDPLGAEVSCKPEPLQLPDQRVQASKLRFITPGPDPVRKPRSAAPGQFVQGQNEFTFDESVPGQLQLRFEVEVCPGATEEEIEELKDKVRFELGTLEGSALQWADGYEQGKGKYQNRQWHAIVRFVGMPALSSSFGAKLVRCRIDGSNTAIEGDFEIFYSKNGRNHLSGQPNSPNWFHYWLQAIGESGNIQFAGSGGNSGGNSLLGETLPSVWNWNASHDKTLIRIFEEASEEGIPYSQAASIRYSGIDLFANIVFHEKRHLYQISEADKLLPNTPGTCFQYGWSFNTATHNHWAPGTDGQWGVAGKDDDLNGVIDDAKPNPLDFDSPGFEPGWDGARDEDLTSNQPSARDWPKAWSLPSRYWPRIEAIEADAVIHAESLVREDKFFDRDWARPGKQHGSKRYSD